MEQRADLIPCILDPIRDCPLSCPNESLSRMGVRTDVAEFKADVRITYESLTDEERKDRFSQVVDILSETSMDETVCLYYQQIMSELYT